MYIYIYLCVCVRVYAQRIAWSIDKQRCGLQHFQMMSIKMCNKNTHTHTHMYIYLCLHNNNKAIVLRINLNKSSVSELFND